MLALVIAEGIAVALLGLLVAGLLRSHAEILRALHELGAGIGPETGHAHPRTATLSPPRLRDSGQGATDVIGQDLDGASAAVAVAGTAHDTVLAFLSTGCATCQPFWSAFRSDPGLPTGTRLVVVVQDEESESRLRELAGPGLDVIASNSTWEDYEVPGSPHFVYVDGPAGRVTGEGTGPDWPSVRGLLTQANADRATRHRSGGTTRPDDDPDWRDNPLRVDAELLAAGIGPGHPSLASPPDGDVGH